MKRNYLFVILCSLLILLPVMTASAQLNKGYKQLKKENFDLAIQAFETDVFNTKTDIAVEAEYNLSKIYFDKKNKVYNLEKAYQYAKSALKRYNSLKNNEIKNLQKKKLGKATIETLKRKVLDEAYNDIKAKNTYEAYENFFLNFDGNTYVNAVKTMIERNKLGLQNAIESNSWNVFETFYKKYHENSMKVSPDVDTLTQLLMFETYMKEQRWSNYALSHFSQNYPENLYVKDSIPSKKYFEIANSTNAEDFKKFIISYPNSYYIRPAKQNIYRMTIESEDIEAYDYFVRIYPDYPGILKLWEKYLTVFSKLNNGNSDDFYKTYPNCPLKKK